MMGAYRSGDPYLAFARQANAVPCDATKQSHQTERERFKVCALAVQYGMGAASLAEKLGESKARGKSLLDLHKNTYPTYWHWSDSVEARAVLTGTLHSTFGWTVHADAGANPRSLRNFPLQANGAEMLRLACCMATERGIRVCAPIHDALLVEAPIGDIENVVRQTRAIMQEASEQVVPGFPLRTDAEIVRWPERYLDPRGEAMWIATGETLSGLGYPLEEGCRP
jgi:DNA polymerase I-like protein with 3'-5' exonuclease and polymerase domains